MFEDQNRISHKYSQLLSANKQKNKKPILRQKRAMQLFQAMLCLLPKLYDPYSQSSGIRRLAENAETCYKIYFQWGIWPE